MVGCTERTGLATVVFTAPARAERKCVLTARVCEICGRGPQFGHRISHAHNVSKRRWNLNLQTVHALVNGAGKRLRVCTSCIRSGKVQKAPLA
jgi:large subunit ribosomal protein L28